MIGPLDNSVMIAGHRMAMMLRVDVVHLEAGPCWCYQPDDVGDDAECVDRVACAARYSAIVEWAEVVKDSDTRIAEIHAETPIPTAPRGFRSGKMRAAKVGWRA